MPKHLAARPPLDADEERQVRRLARRHPGSKTPRSAARLVNSSAKSRSPER